MRKQLQEIPGVTQSADLFDPSWTRVHHHHDLLGTYKKIGEDRYHVLPVGARVPVYQASPLAARVYLFQQFHKTVKAPEPNGQNLSLF